MSDANGPVDLANSANHAANGAVVVPSAVSDAISAAIAATAAAITTTGNYLFPSPDGEGDLFKTAIVKRATAARRPSPS